MIMYKRGIVEESTRMNLRNRAKQSGAAHGLLRADYLSVRVTVVRS